MHRSHLSYNCSSADFDPKAKHIAIIGGGIAGSTAAIHFGELGFNVTLLEKGPSLVNGPPICHLHAGGNLYPDISEQQCIELLQQSIETVRLFPHCLNIRPTVIAVPYSDGGEPNALLPRLDALQASYQALVEQDGRNEVLGKPSDYFKLYEKQQLLELANKVQPEAPVSLDDWIIPFAQHANLETLKFPVVVVQEFGLSVFRMAATAKLSLDTMPHCQVLTHSTLMESNWNNQQWQLTYQDSQHNRQTITADYLINSTGFETGNIDDSIGAIRQRLVEFKAAYVTQWHQCNQQWPEVIFHGPRGTPQGMAQLTPYADGYFQLHGMTKEITLFEGGLVSSSIESETPSSQPDLPERLLKKIHSGWDKAVLEQRTRNAIEHMSQFIPEYDTAIAGGLPLFGAQQIPGNDGSLRAADVSFESNNYARIEVVKASSTLHAARKIAQQWFELPLSQNIESQHKNTKNLQLKEVEQTAINLAHERCYPVALAKVSGEAQSHD